MSTSMSKSGSMRDRSIPRRPLLWLAAALLFTLPPMFGSLVRWVPYVFLLALAMKFWMEPRGYRLRFATLKLMLAAMGLFAIFASYGSLKGVEPGILLLVVLLFVLFPRMNTGLRVDFRANRLANSGFSDRLSPGSIAALANSSEIAFRAEFPGSTATPPGSLYWRGAVMWNCDGMEWRAPYVPVSISSRGRGIRQSSSNNTIRQRITLAPHGARWMFALDRPSEIPPGAILARGDYLWSIQTIRK